MTNTLIKTTHLFLFFGTLLINIFKNFIDMKKIKKFYFIFLFFFILSPALYLTVSLLDKTKRTDYPGREIAKKTQIIWSQDFDKQIDFVTGDEWKAGNLSYHLQSRPRWEGLTNDKILNDSSQFICIDDVCLGRY